MTYIWVAIIVLLIIVELLTVNLTTIWFVISGIISLITSFYNDDFKKQFLIFIILGILLLIIVKPFIKQFLRKFQNRNYLVGSVGVVTETIKKNNYGEIEINGTWWTAYSDDKLEIDSVVTVVEKHGNKLKVEKVDIQL